MKNKKWEIKFPEFPYYLTIFAEYDAEQDSVKVTIHSKIHVNKLVVMPNTWSGDFVKHRPKEFRADVFDYVIKAYHLKKQPEKYA